MYLGIAKILPPVGPVKRETLYVVSLAMTGLVRGPGPVFHIVENRTVAICDGFPIWPTIFVLDRISR